MNSLFSLIWLFLWSVSRIALWKPYRPRPSLKTTSVWCDTREVWVDQNWVWSFKNVWRGQRLSCEAYVFSSYLTGRTVSCLRVRKGWTFCKPKRGPVRIRHSSHDFGWQSSHSVDLAGSQAKMASIEIWIPWRTAHKPHSRHLMMHNRYYPGPGSDMTTCTSGNWWCRILNQV